MKIATIVNSKGSGFVTVRENALLAEAVTTMHRHSIGSVGVTDRNASQILGIVSQTELMAGIAQRGVHALHLPAVIFMRKRVMFCRCSDDAAHVMLMMTQQRNRHSIVHTDDGSIAGLVSLGDLVAALLDEARLEADVLRDMARGRLLSLAG